MSEMDTTPSLVDTVTFASLNLRPELLRALEIAKYTTPTPIQAAVIPAVMEGHDVLAGAQTGTGKTAGFVLPVLQTLMASMPSGKNIKRGSYARRPIRALVLTPTRELAAQVEQSVQNYGRFLPLTSFTIFGGVAMNPQIRALQRGMDILVATPGRLLDHQRQGTLDLSQVEILILDEADRMLDMGFVRDIRQILPLMPEVRQRLLFSATFSSEIKTLAGELLNDPRHIEVARPNLESALVTQQMYAVKTEQKRDLLVHILKTEATGQVLVFTRTKHGADRLVKQLAAEGVASLAIHGNRSQSQRTFALDQFKSGRARVLVATDIAARGLDIPQLPHVINYEIPNVPEDYVHRIGRTGRAGIEGLAISLVSPDERKEIHAIERLIGKTLIRGDVDGLTFEMPAAAPRPMPGERPMQQNRDRSAPRRHESLPQQEANTNDPARQRDRGRDWTPHVRPVKTAANHTPRHKRRASPSSAS